MSILESKIHYYNHLRQYVYLFFHIEPLSLFLISTTIWFIFLSHIEVFPPCPWQKLNSSRLNGSSALTAHITFCCLITNLFSTSLCDLPQPPGSLVPVQHRFSIAMIAMTHKRDGYLALASQPFCMSLIPWQLPAPTGSSNVRWGSMYRDGGRRRRETGVEGAKRGIRRIILLSVIIEPKCLIKSQNCQLFGGEWKLFHLIKLVAFHFQVYDDNCSL